MGKGDKFTNTLKEMRKETLLNRIARLERLAKIAREDKLLDRVMLAYCLIKRCYSELTELLNCNPHFWDVPEMQES